MTRHRDSNPVLSVDSETPDPFGYLDRWWLGCYGSLYHYGEAAGPSAADLWRMTMTIFACDPCGLEAVELGCVLFWIIVGVLEPWPIQTPGAGWLGLGLG